MSTREISIYDEIFSVNAPYLEGAVVNAVEAKTLNQTRAENIANNFRKRIKAALEAVPLKEGAEIETLEDIRTAFAAYDVEYTFSMPSVGREPIDPLEREIQKIAKQGVKAKITEAGRKLKDYTEEQLENAYAIAEQNEDVIKEAKRRLSAQKKAAANSLADLGLE